MVRVTKNERSVAPILRIVKSKWIYVQQGAQTKESQVRGREIYSDAREIPTTELKTGGDGELDYLIMIYRVINFTLLIYFFLFIVHCNNTIINVF